MGTKETGMGIDLENYGHKRSGNRKHEQSNDPYLHLLVKLYKFLARRTNSNFNATVYKRLKMSRTNRPPVSLSKIQLNAKKSLAKNDKAIVVVVGTVTNDERLYEFSKTNVCAMRFTTAARERIIKAGGKAYTFDQLALERPTGAYTILVQGRRNAREAVRHFKGLRGKHAAPRVGGGHKIRRGGERTHTRSKF